MACQFRTCFSSSSFRAYTAEFISTFLFVFVAVGSAVSARMLTPNVAYGATPLVATALAQGFALFAAVYIAADISGGHVNPAVTFAMAICDYISVPSAITYCIVQILASTMASFLIHFISTEAIPTTRVATAMSGFGGAVVETVITFALVYTVLVAADPRNQREKKQQTGSVVGPLAIGLVCSACILAAGSLTGASMNPARSFGPAMVSGKWGNQAVYWVGPLVGAALAGLVHRLLYSNRVGSGLNESVVV